MANIKLTVTIQDHMLKEVDKIINEWKREIGVEKITKSQAIQTLISRGIISFWDSRINQRSFELGE